MFVVLGLCSIWFVITFRAYKKFHIYSRLLRSSQRCCYFRHRFFFVCTCSLLWFLWPKAVCTCQVLYCNIYKYEKKIVSLSKYTNQQGSIYFVSLYFNLTLFNSFLLYGFVIKFIIVNFKQIGYNLPTENGKDINWLLLSLLSEIAAILKIEWKKETWVELCQREFLICYGRVSFNQEWTHHLSLRFHFLIFIYHLMSCNRFNRGKQIHMANRKLLLPFCVQCSSRVIHFILLFISQEVVDGGNY